MNIAVLLELEKKRLQGPNPYCRGFLFYSKCLVWNIKHVWNTKNVWFGILC